MKNATAGFTLIELLIVIAIIGILAAVLIPNLLSARSKANDTATMSYVRNCYTSVELNRDSQGNLNSSAAGMDKCSTLPQAPVATPTAVKTEGAITYANGNYTVKATSVTGKDFTFDGTKMTEGAAASN